ncbi:hypothetical protein MASR2M70_13570 [Bacillota bacterium]
MGDSITVTRTVTTGGVTENKTQTYIITDLADSLLTLDFHEGEINAEAMQEQRLP